MTPSVSTGRVRVSRFTMVVGEPTGTIVTVAEDAPPPQQQPQQQPQPPPELADALAAAPAPPADEPQGAVEDVGEVTSKIERAVELFTLVATGELNAEAVSKELDALLSLLGRLDRAGRFDEALRLARPLQGLLALALRWASLVEALQIALHAAEAVADVKAMGWVHHELGSLGLGAEDAHAAESQLTQARALRERSGDSAGLRATEQNLATLRAAFPPSGFSWSTRTLAIVGATVLMLVILAVVLVPALDDDNDTETAADVNPVTTTEPPTPKPPSDVVAPSVTITKPTEPLTPSATVTIEGTAGDARGDKQTVRLTVRERSSDGTVVAGPLDVERVGTDWKQDVMLPLDEGEHMQYIAEATQLDDADNESPPATLTFAASVPSAVE